MKNFKYTFALICLMMFGCNRSDNGSQNLNSTISDLSTSVKTTQLISEPLPMVKSAPIIFTIDPTKEQKLVTEKGSKIIIPKNAFVDMKGKPLTGDVTIEFEEFHDATDIILSGIPMNIITEEGEQAAFESAGMFRIEGTQNGEEIQLANNKTMEIQLVSYKSGDDFNFYEYSEAEGNWIEKEESIKEVVNEERREALKKLSKEPLRPIEVKKASNTDFVFDIAVNREINPEFAHLEDVMWRLTDNPNDESLFAETIRSPRLECIDQAQSIFRLTGRTSSGTIMRNVQPVLFGGNWKKAQTSFREKLAKYKEGLAERKVEKQRVSMMTKTTRNLRILGFGIFNCDRIYQMKPIMRFNALFFVPVLNRIFKKGWLIQGRRKITIPYSASTMVQFVYNPREKNTVITIDDDGYVYEFTSEDFQEIDNSTLLPTDTYTFRMRETGIKIEDKDDLSNYLATL